YLLARYSLTCRSAPVRSCAAQPVLILRDPSRMTQTARLRSVPSRFRSSGRSQSLIPLAGRGIIPSCVQLKRAWCNPCLLSARSQVGPYPFPSVIHWRSSSHRDRPRSLQRLTAVVCWGRSYPALEDREECGAVASLVRSRRKIVQAVAERP